MLRYVQGVFVGAYLWVLIRPGRAVPNRPPPSSPAHAHPLASSSPGYDIIIDDDLKPWLVEVNASPSLTATTSSDRIMKHTLIHDVLSVLCPDGRMPDLRSPHQPTKDQLGQVGCVRS